MKRFTVSLVFALVLVAALAVPVLAQGPTRSGELAFGRDINVGQGEVVRGDLVAFGGDVTVASGARVQGTLVAFGGDVTLLGEVEEDVVAFGGNVTLRAGSLVRQDVTAIGGQVDRAESARVDGYVSSGSSMFNWGPDTQLPRIRTLDWRAPFNSLLWGFVNALLTLLVLTGLAVVIVAVFPRPVAGVQATLISQPGNSAGIGCLALIVAVTLTIPLIITCIGPFLMWAGIVAAIVFGLSALGLWVGTRLGGGGPESRRNPVAAAAAGTALIVLLLTLLDAVPFVGCVGWVFGVLVASLALGAVILSKFGTQPPASNGQSPLPASPTMGGTAGSDAATSTTPPEVAKALSEPVAPAPPEPPAA